MEQTYLMYCVAYGKYDISFAIKALTEEEALNKAKQELESDGIKEYTNLVIQ